VFYFDLNSSPVAPSVGEFQFAAQCLIFLCNQSFVREDCVHDAIGFINGCPLKKGLKTMFTDPRCGPGHSNWQREEP